MHIKSRDMSQGISLLLGFQAPVLSDWLFRPLSERSADSLKRKRVAFSPRSTGAVRILVATANGGSVPEKGRSTRRSID